MVTIARLHAVAVALPTFSDRAPARNVSRTARDRKMSRPLLRQLMLRCQRSK